MGHDKDVRSAFNKMKHQFAYIERLQQRQRGIQDKIDLARDQIAVQAARMEWLGVAPESIEQLRAAAERDAADDAADG